MRWPWRKPAVYVLRLHLEAQGSPIDTVEGIGPLTLEAGHYRLVAPKALEGAEKTVALEGELAVPAGRVLFAQVLPG